MELTTTQKAKLKIYGRVKIGVIQKPGWKASLPLYAFNCPRHGLQVTYPQGFNDSLDCPECLKMFESFLCGELIEH